MCLTLPLSAWDYCRSLIAATKLLYGIPLSPSQVHRLGQLGKKLGPKSISVLLDDISQLSLAMNVGEAAGFPLPIFIKVDTGYHRAGLTTISEAFRRLVQAVLETKTHGICPLVGFYSHAGHSYGGTSEVSAMEMLAEEIEGLEKAVAEANSIQFSASYNTKYILSVGATPTTTSIENLRGEAHEPAAERLESLIQRVQRSCSLELHAGVYPFLDMQQLATRARPSPSANSKGTQSHISLADIALSILVEVASVYDHREKPEALIAAGTLALGREPCKSYEGWGLVSDWGMKTDDTMGECGWQVGRISQEHSVLTRNDESNSPGYAKLRVGQRLRIWPNHACVASAGFSWYLVVDSRLPEDRQDEVVDVWIRCRGW